MRLMPEEIGVIGVLMGGVSAERDISLKSGRAVAAALKEKGYHVAEIIVETADEALLVEQLRASQARVYFVALHGAFGEDGKIQALLDGEGWAYTGSGPEASCLAMNKVQTQKLLEDNNLRVPPACVFHQGDDVKFLLDWVKRFPIVVKPALEGSSIGISIVHQAGDIPSAVEVALEYGSSILIEEFIKGREVTAGILNGQALPLVEIKPKLPFFDFTAKYQTGMSEYLVPAPLREEISRVVQQMASQVFQVLGCRDFCRVDFILDQENIPYILEANTIPGFTATSLLPMAAKAAGITFEELCVEILSLAHRRALTSL